MNVYKIVKRERDGRLVSSFTRGLSALEYFTDRPTVPDFGKLFALDTPENAWEYLSIGDWVNEDRMQLWRSEAPDMEIMRKVAFWGYSRVEFEYWWRHPEDHGDDPDNNLIPFPDTLTCSSIQLIERIPRPA